jgi:hypothetical protein
MVTGILTMRVDWPGLEDVHSIIILGIKVINE